MRKEKIYYITLSYEDRYRQPTNRDTATLQDMVINFAREASKFTSRDQLLSAEIERLLLENEALINKNKSLIQKNRLLLAQLSLLRHQSFGNSSEKLSDRISGLELQIEETETEIACTSTAEGTKAARKEKGLKAGRSKAKPRGRKKLPDNLPREEKIMAAAAECLGCGSSDMRKIEDDVSEVLEYVPSSF